MKVNTFELLRRCTVEHDWTIPPEGLEAMLAGASPRLIGKAAADHGVADLVFLSTRALPALDPELRSLLGTVHHASDGIDGVQAVVAGDAGTDRGPGHRGDGGHASSRGRGRVRPGGVR